MEEDRIPALMNLNFSGEIILTLTKDVWTNIMTSDSIGCQDDEDMIIGT